MGAVEGFLPVEFGLDFAMGFVLLSLFFPSVDILIPRGKRYVDLGLHTTFFSTKSVVFLRIFIQHLAILPFLPLCEVVDRDEDTISLTSKGSHLILTIIDPKSNSNNNDYVARLPRDLAESKHFNTCNSPYPMPLIPFVQPACMNNVLRVQGCLNCRTDSRTRTLWGSQSVLPAVHKIHT